MEHRFYLGVCLLAVFLILGLFATFSMDSAAIPVAQQLEQAAQEALSGNMKTGISLAESAKAGWYDHWKCFATVSDHSPMDEIDGLFSEMDIYAQAADSVHFSACCAQLSELVEAMADAHRFTWWNLL